MNSEMFMEVEKLVRQVLGPERFHATSIRDASRIEPRKCIMIEGIQMKWYERERNQKPKKKKFERKKKTVTSIDLAKSRGCDHYWKARGWSDLGIRLGSLRLV